MSFQGGKILTAYLLHLWPIPGLFLGALHSLLVENLGNITGSEERSRNNVPVTFES